MHFKPSQSVHNPKLDFSELSLEKSTHKLSYFLHISYLDSAEAAFLSALRIYRCFNFLRNLPGIKQVGVRGLNNITASQRAEFQYRIVFQALTFCNMGSAKETFNPCRLVLVALPPSTTSSTSAPVPTLWAGGVGGHSQATAEAGHAH